MTELILTVVLWVAKLIFENVDDKKKVGKLISEWMIVMRKQFLSSAEVSKHFDDMWKQAAKNKWKETK